MVVSILLSLGALRSGLRLRSQRRLRGRLGAGTRRRHLRLARTAVGMISVGFLGGLASSFWLRGFGLFSTAHGLVGSAALLLFLATAALGRELEGGRSRRHDLHAGLALAAIGLAVAAFFTGFVLLP